MTLFRIESTRIIRSFDIVQPVAPMDTDGLWFRPDEVDVTVGNGHLVQVEFIGSRCTVDGLPLARTREQQDDPRYIAHLSRCFSHTDLETTRAGWPLILQQIVEHVESLED